MKTETYSNCYKMFH